MTTTSHSSINHVHQSIWICPAGEIRVETGIGEIVSPGPWTPVELAGATLAAGFEGALSNITEVTDWLHSGSGMATTHKGITSNFSETIRHNQHRADGEDFGSAQTMAPTTTPM